jgi:hypothetical protein
MRSQLTPVVDLVVGVLWSKQQSNIRVLVAALRHRREGSREHTDSATISECQYSLKVATITIEVVDRIGLAACSEIGKPLVILSPAQMKSLTIFADWQLQSASTARWRACTWSTFATRQQQ